MKASDFNSCISNFRHLSKIPDFERGHLKPFFRICGYTFLDTIRIGTISKYMDYLLHHGQCKGGLQ